MGRTHLAVGVLSGQDGKLFQGSCSMGWYSSNGSCFKYIAMLSQKANLASIYDPAESLTWIGLSNIHKEGRLCSHNWPGGMQWNDLKCSNLFAFVCAN
uniref:C-type lectin domain-containing protein n=1 Tax=Oncorhynchus kisutch TaxID=8019 RepID=A0A8C7CH28_ONCKI